MHSLRNMRKSTLKKAAHVEMLKVQHEWLQDISNQLAAHCLVGAIGVFERRGRSPEYIKKFVEDYKSVMAMGNLFGKQIISNDIQTLYSEKYGIDFSEIRVNLESEKDFIRRNS